MGDLAFGVSNNGCVAVYHMLYYPSNPKGELYLLDSNGNVVWQSSELMIEQLKISSNGNFIIGCRGKLYAIDGSNGSILWDYRVGNVKKVVFSSDEAQALVVFSDSTISPKYDKVYLFDKNKRVVWKYKLEYRTYRNIVYGNIVDVEAPGDFAKIYITTEKGCIICLDKNGQKIWETKLSNFNPLRISKNGKIVAALNIRDTYEVYMFERVEKAEEPKATPTKTPTPRATMTHTPEHEALHATRTPGFDVILTLATSITALVILKFKREN